MVRIYYRCGKLYICSYGRVYVYIGLGKFVMKYLVGCGRINDRCVGSGGGGVWRYGEVIGFRGGKVVIVFSRLVFGVSFCGLFLFVNIIVVLFFFWFSDF